jgi:CRISPR system Cascade subunit CasD
MHRYLVFQLYGPLVSWGEQAVGEARHSATHPSRSAVLGLLAAALGIKRPDTVGKPEEREYLERQHLLLADSIGVGVKVDSAGIVLKDYHTTQVPPQNKKARHLFTRRDELRAEKLGTILSSREYRQDALYIAALWLKGEGGFCSLQDLKDALQRPFFTLYFGRKSCPPALPLNPIIVEADSLKSVLDQYPRPLFSESEFVVDRLRRKLQTLYFWEACEHSGMQEDFRTPRYDEPISRSRWQFASREEFARLRE